MAFEARPQLLRNFMQRRASGEEDNDPDMVNGIHPDWLLVHRVIAKKQTLCDTQYLTKWCALLLWWCLLARTALESLYGFSHVKAVLLWTFGSGD